MRFHSPQNLPYHTRFITSQDLVLCQFPPGKDFNWTNVGNFIIPRCCTIGISEPKTCGHVILWKRPTNFASKVRFLSKESSSLCACGEMAFKMTHVGIVKPLFDDGLKQPYKVWFVVEKNMVKGVFISSEVGLFFGVFILKKVPDPLKKWTYLVFFFSDEGFLWYGYIISDPNSKVSWITSKIQKKRNNNFDIPTLWMLRLHLAIQLLGSENVTPTREKWSPITNSWSHDPRLDQC